MFAVPWMWYNHNDFVVSVVDTIRSAGLQIAAVITHKPKTVEDLKTKYSLNIQAKEPSIKIMIVPGHEPDYGGAEFGSLKEREFNTILANNLEKFLKANPRYEVFVSRSDDAWHPILKDYFENSWEEIIDWNKSYKSERENLVRVGQFTNKAPSVVHNVAPSGPATRLVGMNKWGKENDVDITIHIHFNDDPAHRYGVPGKFSGFAVYIPEEQYYNSATTKAIAEKVFSRMAKYNPVSDLSGESGGIVESPDLIAIGSNNSIDSASMLIEYGYIYEPQYRNEITRELAIKDLAYQTYLGLQDFFDPNDSLKLSRKYDTLWLPYYWNNNLTDRANDVLTQDIFALQTALTNDGVYPPVDRDKNDCPRTGSIGNCTKSALQAFQIKYGIIGESGVVGEKTREVLNREYGRDK